MGEERLGAGTQAVWGGEERARHGEHTQVPVVHSVSYGYDDVDHWMAVALGEERGHIYGRNSNPTVAVFEEKIRLLEEGEAATSASTGMAAISNTLFALLAPRKRVVSVRDTYGGTNQVFAHFLPQYGVEVALCDTSDHDAIEAEVARRCDILYLETPTNPTLKVLDLERLSGPGMRRVRSWWSTTPLPPPSTKSPSCTVPTWWSTRPPSTSGAMRTPWGVRWWDGPISCSGSTTIGR
jgi:cystathionine gamma-synthase